MDKQKLSEPQPIRPMAIAVLGTGDGAPMKSGMVAETPGKNTPNIVVTVISPVVAILVRLVHTYLTILVGLVGAGMTSDIIPYADFIDLTVKCAGLSVAGAGVGLIKDLATVFGKLEGRFPLLTGGV